MPDLDNFYQDLADNQAKQQQDTPKPAPKKKDPQADKDKESTNDLQMKMIKELQDMVSQVNNKLYGDNINKKFNEGVENFGKEFLKGLKGGFGAKGKDKGSNDDDKAPDAVENMGLSDDAPSTSSGKSNSSSMSDSSSMSSSSSFSSSSSSSSNSKDDIEDMEFGDDLESVFQDSPMEAMSMDTVTNPTSSDTGLGSMQNISGGGDASKVLDNPEVADAAMLVV